MKPTLSRPCPLCGQGPLLLHQFPDTRIVATTSAKEQLLGGLVMYTCAGSNHVIFFRAADVEAEIHAGAVATSAGR